MDKELYQTLINQFAMYDKNEVLEILNSQDSSDEAIAAAKYVLSGDSKEVKSYKEKVNKENELLQKREDNIISYDGSEMIISFQIHRMKISNRLQVILGLWEI